MKKTIKIMALGALMASTSAYAVSVAACAGCHGQYFEKKAMGVSKIVKEMSKEEIIAALKGYKDGTYGGPMKNIMVGQVANLSDDDIKAIANMIKSGAGSNTDQATSHASAAAVAVSKTIDINAKACDPERIKKEDLGVKKVITEESLGLRKSNLYEENNASPVASDYNRPAPGTSTRFKRAYVNAPPMIPHSVEGMLPITKDNNQCLGCHMPDVAPSVGATPIPPTHFINYRPTTEYKNGELIKEGKVVGPKGELGNVGDITLAKEKHLKKLYPGRFNCTQCHAPQAKVEPVVGNTFQPDGLNGELESHSNLSEVIDEGVK